MLSVSCDPQSRCSKSCTYIRASSFCVESYSTQKRSSIAARSARSCSHAFRPRHHERQAHALRLHQVRQLGLQLPCQACCMRLAERCAVNIHNRAKLTAAPQRGLIDACDPGAAAGANRAGLTRQRASRRCASCRTLPRTSSSAICTQARQQRETMTDTQTCGREAPAE